MPDLHVLLSHGLESGPGGTKIQAIAFKQSRHYDKVAGGAAFDVTYNIEENTFRGNTTLQLNVKDLR